MPRKKTEIDWKFVDRMLQKMCDGTEIAQALGITEDTLYNRCKQVHKMDFSAYKAQKRAKTIEKLRSKQVTKALEGNVSMLIWLGKQYLGQKDKHELAHKGEVDNRITSIEYVVPAPPEGQRINEIETAADVETAPGTADIAG